MSNITVTKQSGALPMAPEQVDILRKTLFKTFNDDEIAFSLAVCNRTGLDPFLRQIHFTKRKNRKNNEETIVIQTGVDGFRLTASRTGLYAGSDEPVFKEDEKGPLEAKVTVWKLVGGVRCPFTATARWAEYYPGDTPDGFMWRKMPYVMLGKCAETQALRKAFPAELSNVYSNEEMGQADNAKEVIQTKARELTQAVQETTETPEFESAEYFDGGTAEGAATETSPGPGNYVINVGGMLKNKMLKDCKKSQLEQFVTWVDGLGEKAHPDVVACKEHILEYLMEASGA